MFYLCREQFLEYDDYVALILLQLFILILIFNFMSFFQLLLIAGCFVIFIC